MTISRIPDKQATKSRIPCPNFGESRFPGSSQIPNPVKIFSFSRILHLILVKSRIPRIPFQTLSLQLYRETYTFVCESHDNFNNLEPFKDSTTASASDPTMEQEQGECSTASKRPRRSAYREGHRSKLSIPCHRTTSNMMGSIATLPNFSHFGKARITLHLPLTVCRTRLARKNNNRLCFNDLTAFWIPRLG